MKNVLRYLSIWLIIGSLSSLLVGCEEVIDLKLREADPRLVVEGYITTDTIPWRIRLTRTQEYYSDHQNSGEAGAIVIVSDSLFGIKDTLPYRQNGYYQSNTLRSGIPGNRYSLYIRTADGQEYTAQDYMPTLLSVDSVNFQYVPPGTIFREGYYLCIYAQEPPELGNAYRFTFYKNDTLARKPIEYFADDDRFINGQYLNGVRTMFKAEPGDTFLFELYSINHRQLHYYQQLTDQINHGGSPFDSPPVNVPSNISNNALGYFMVTAVSRKGGIVP
ncbi:MAG: DUF4249 domain-containing protein [Bacteroidia bacterium]|nr:DUF4249 domain-containing protein [Bacteroidia bacterium]